MPKEQLAFPASCHYNNDKDVSKSAPKFSFRQKTTILDKKITLTLKINFRNWKLSKSLN